MTVLMTNEIQMKATSACISEHALLRIFLAAADHIHNRDQP